MKKIKAMLIHWLGGHTDKDMAKYGLEETIESFEMVKEFMERLNGTDADTWCKKAYSYVSDMIVWLKED